jgi:hypothetical protein
LVWLPGSGSECALEGTNADPKHCSLGKDTLFMKIIFIINFRPEKGLSEKRTVRDLPRNRGLVPVVIRRFFIALRQGLARLFDPIPYGVGRDVVLLRHISGRDEVFQHFPNDFRSLFGAEGASTATKGGRKTFGGMGLHSELNRKQIEE